MVRENNTIIAVYTEESAAVQCGYCGKTLCICTKKRPKRARSEEKKEGIIIKCSRCKSKNLFPI